jgi:glycosyltransferase involved in cell wall biosynthesis
LTEKIKRAKLVFAITKFCKSQLQRWVGHDQWSKIKIVHCGLDDTFFDEQLTPKTVDKNNINLLFIGRLCEQKGPLILMETLKSLREKNLPVNVTFAGDGELRSEIEAYAHRYNLTKYITITGWVDSTKIRSLLLSTDMMVLPSFAEGLPVAIMEAMASKVPVVSTRIAGIPELVRNLDTGFIVSPGCSDELSDAIQTLIELSTVERQDLLERAYQAVYTNHNARNEAAIIHQYLVEKS